MKQHYAVDRLLPSIRSVLAEGMRNGPAGRGVACHARAVGRYDAGRQTALLELARDVGLGLVSGFGRHNLLEVAFLAAHLPDMRAAPQLEVLLDLITTSAARVLGLAGYGLREGGPADLLVHDAVRTVDLLARHAPPRVVIRAGRVLHG